MKKIFLDFFQQQAKNRVYSFAASGAGLSQHLVWAKLANEKYKVIFYFVIIANDFLESLNKYGRSPGFPDLILEIKVIGIYH